MSYHRKVTFEEKVVLLVGATSDVGAATAMEFSKLGADLVITGTDLEKLDKVAEQCDKAPFIIQADTTKEEDAKNVIESVIAKFGKLNVLVNNADILETGTIESTSLEHFDTIFNTNFRSIYRLILLALPHLIKTYGNIVNVSSLAGIDAFPNLMSYCVSKAALDQFTNCVAKDLKSKYVRVNSINPALKVTELPKQAGKTEIQYEEYIDDQKPNGTTKYIVFLASDEADFITGVQLPAHGRSNIKAN